MRWTRQTAILRYGLSMVDTHVLTPPEQPYVIEYHVTDAAGNAATVKRRRVYVYNPCSDGDDGSSEFLCAADGRCSVHGLCESAMMLDEAAAVPPMPPTLTLLGPSNVTVAGNTTYSKCTRDAPVRAQCSPTAHGLGSAQCMAWTH